MDAAHARPGLGDAARCHVPICPRPALPVLAYVYVGEAAATLTEIEAAGGTRTGDPMSAPGMGTFGYFTDLSGTQMGLLGPA